MKAFGFAISGVMVGAAISAGACCFQPSAPSGDYTVVSWSLTGKDPLDADTQLDVDDDVVKETFTRNGKRYEIEYQVVERVEGGISGTPKKRERVSLRSSPIDSTEEWASDCR